jgi:hypothetical protein
MSTPARFHPRSHAAALVFALACTLALAARADCIDDAAARHQVNAMVLRAIGWHESRLQPQALAHNANGSIDVGAFQINSVHLSELGRHGIDRAALADGCTSAEVAAWHYRRQVDRQGNSWQAVGAYHSATPERAAWYANRIASILVRWNALPTGTLPFPPDTTIAPGQSHSPASERRTNGAPTSVTPAAPAARSVGPTPTVRAPQSAASAPAPQPVPRPAFGVDVAACRALAYRPTSR